MVLVVTFSVSWAQTADAVGSLVDVILSNDRLRLERVLAQTGPYDKLQDAYSVARGINALGSSDVTKKVCYFCKRWCALIGVYTGCRDCLQVCISIKAQRSGGDLLCYLHSESSRLLPGKQHQVQWKSQNCFYRLQYSATDEVRKALSNSLKGSPDTRTLYYAVTSMANIGMSSKEGKCWS